MEEQVPYAKMGGRHMGWESYVKGTWEKKEIPLFVIKDDSMGAGEITYGVFDKYGKLLAITFSVKLALDAAEAFAKYEDFEAK